MKSLILKSLGLLAVLSLVSCSSDDDPNIDYYIHTPNLEDKSPVRSITRSGFVKEAYDWTFEYNSNGNMTSAKSVYKDASGVVGQDNEYYISYGSSNVSVRTTAANPMQFSVNDACLLATAKSGNTEYRYNYDMDGRLIGWSSVNYNTGFDETSTNAAKAELLWDNKNLKSVTYTPLTNIPDDYIRYEFEYTDEWNDNGILPEIDTKALGCKGFEFMYYAGMMGKATGNLIDCVVVTYSKDPAKNISYKYDGYRYPEYGNSRNLMSFNFAPENSTGNVTIVTFDY